MICSVEGCDRPGVKRTWCEMHYQRWKAHGTTDDPRPSAIDRFMSHVVVTSDCWLWTGWTWKGYGSFCVDYGKRVAHRWLYEQLVGEVPERMDLDHTCHNASTNCPGGDACLHRRCVNPAHLEPVTHSENVKRSPLTGDRVHALKTHCPAGHPYDLANTRRSKGGTRSCRTCQRDSMRALRQRRAAA